MDRPTLASLRDLERFARDGFQGAQRAGNPILDSLTRDERRELLAYTVATQRAFGEIEQEAKKLREFDGVDKPVCLAGTVCPTCQRKVPMTGAQRAKKAREKRG